MVSYGRCMDTNKNVRLELATRIENHMAAKGIKRKELIQALPMGHQAFERRMRGELDFGITEIWTIATVLRTTPIDLLPAEPVQVANAA